MIFLFIFADTVEALLMKTLVNGQLYLWPPSWNPVSTPYELGIFTIT